MPGPPAASSRHARRRPIVIAVVLIFACFCLLTSIRVAHAWTDLGLSLAADLAQSRLNTNATTLLSSIIAQTSSSSSSSSSSTSIPTSPDTSSLATSTQLRDMARWATLYGFSTDGAWTTSLFYLARPADSCNYLRTRDCPTDLCLESSVSTFVDLLFSALSTASTTGAGTTSTTALSPSLTSISMFLPSSPAQQAAFALRMYVALVLTLHSPIRLAHTSDTFGQDVNVLMAGLPSNLGLLWENGAFSGVLYAAHHASYVDYITALQQRLNTMSASTINEWTDCGSGSSSSSLVSSVSSFGACTQRWANETSQLVCSDVYTTPDVDGRQQVDATSSLSRAYVSNAVVQLETQVLKAAVRLAASLNSFADQWTAYNASGGRDAGAFSSSGSSAGGSNSASSGPSSSSSTGSNTPGIASSGGTVLPAASSSGSSASSSSSSTGSGPAPGVVGDPVFHGFFGQSFQVHGIDGAVYSLISSLHMQFNARFEFMSGPRECPRMPSTNRRASACWTHKGSYLGELGLKTSGGDRVHIVPGPAATGFQSVRVNGVELDLATLPLDAQPERGSTAVPLQYDLGAAPFPLPAPHPSPPTQGWIVRMSSHEVLLRVCSFEIYLENVDSFVNLGRVRILSEDASWPDLSTLRSHGLLGQTWHTRTYPTRLRYIMGEADDYVMQENDLFGDDFVYNSFVPRVQQMKEQ